MANQYTGGESVIGQTFGYLTVLDDAPPIDKWKKRRVKCRCDCGHVGTYDLNALRRGGTKSCGCVARERAASITLRHGMAHTPTYESWASAKQRCTNPSNPAYSRYGGRGITMCAEWVGSFDAFFHDMGERPSLLHSLDRIDNDGPYAPRNCRWATARQQNQNKRSARHVTHRGETLNITEWARRLGMSANTIRKRLSAGMTPELALKPRIR